MKDEWYCLNCEHTTELDKHGRCFRCNSNAVTEPSDRQPWWVRKLQRDAQELDYTAQQEIDEIRRLYEL